MGAILDWYDDTHVASLARPDTPRLAAKYLKPFMGDLPVSQLNLAVQERYVEHRRKAGANTPSIKRDLESLSAALHRAARSERIDRAPPILSLPTAPPRERFLTRAEAMRLLWALRDGRKRSRHVLLFAMLALHTGARTTAILQLTWDRVDLKNGLVYYAKPGVRVRNKKRGTAPLDPILIVMLKAEKRRSQSDHVITWAGRPVGRIAKAFIDRAQAVGLTDVTPHVLRHTFASWAAQGGVSMFDIGEVIGQTVQATTERYAKHSPDRLRHVTKAVRRLR